MAMILLIEDEKLLRWSLQQRLEKEGHTVHTAECLEEAEVHISHHLPDMVLLDLSLPDGHGLDYYEKNARTFVESTLQVDMWPLYQRFLPLLPENAHILDAGCGSGRDAKYFIEHGYQVTAFDASAEIAALAEKEIGQPVQVQCLQDIQYQNQFDGVWACASLLHVPAEELPDVFRRLVHALKPNGVIYCSFKYGQGEYEKEGRRFTYMDDAGLQALLEGIGELSIKELWVTADRRPEREHEQWLNGVLGGLS